MDFVTRRRRIFGCKSVHVIGL